MNISIALARSRTSSGLAICAQKLLCHLIAAITGYVVSETAVCIDWAAIRPGTTKAR